jgi:hypothetical protein
MCLTGVHTFGDCVIKRMLMKEGERCVKMRLTQQGEICNINSPGVSGFILTPMQVLNKPCRSSFSGVPLMH